MTKKMTIFRLLRNGIVNAKMQASKTSRYIRHLDGHFIKSDKWEMALTERSHLLKTKDHLEVSRLFDLLYASPFYMTYITIQVIYSNERMKYVLLRGSSMRSDRKGLYCLSTQEASGWNILLEWIQWKSVQSCKHNLHVTKYIAYS